ncbi:RNA-binding domain-containing protein, partial [Ramaria rubella]
MATSSASSSDSRISGRDTRTQLFVGNVGPELVKYVSGLNSYSSSFFFQLPYRVRWQDLKDLFRKAGTVLRADVSLGLDNRSRGYGTVLLATSEDAARAVDMFNGYNWQTRTLEVRPDRLPPDFDNPNFMMTGNSGSLTTSSAGHPFPIPMHPIPYGNSLGDGVSIPGPDDFDISKLFGEQTRSASGAGTRNLFVGNLPFHCQWQDLKDLFRQAGTIVRADVALGPDGRSRGFGTVSFANDTDAERALNIFNGYEYNGRTLKVHYDK